MSIELSWTQPICNGGTCIYSWMGDGETFGWLEPGSASMGMSGSCGDGTSWSWLISGAPGTAGCSDHFSVGQGCIDKDETLSGSASGSLTGLAVSPRAVVGTVMFCFG